MAYPSNDEVDGGQLKKMIERIEKIEDERSVLGLGIREIYAEAKATGYDARIIKKIITARRKAETARKEEAALLKVYAQAIGQLDLFA